MDRRKKTRGWRVVNRDEGLREAKSYKGSVSLYYQAKRGSPRRSRRDERKRAATVDGKRGSLGQMHIGVAKVPDVH